MTQIQQDGEMDVVIKPATKLVMDPNLEFLLKNLSLNIPSNRTFTEGGGVGTVMAFKTSGRACVDFFGKVARSTSVAKVIEKFVAAWNESPETALNLLLNMRDIRCGKGEKKLPIVLMYFLSVWKPQTYLAVYPEFLQLGCFRDFLLIAELATRCKDMPNFKREEAFFKENIELKAFSSQLAEDLRKVEADSKAGISLCAKWAPTEDGHFDKQPLLFARQLAKMRGGDQKEYQKEYRGVLTKLRGHLDVLEKMMCDQKWDQINFESIPAKAHRHYRKAFERGTNAKNKELNVRKALKTRYAEYQAQLVKGEAKINSTGTQPHELIKPYLPLHFFNIGMEYDREIETPVDLTLEGQWKDMIAKLAESGNFENVQAVVDVSGSMEGQPMQVAIALGLVVAELTTGPFKNKLITFHETPTLHTVVGDTLKDRVADVMRMDAGLSTDIVKVFQLLLDEIKENPDAKMVEKVFIFSDMQFNQASGHGNEWKTSYEVIQKMYVDAGRTVPKIVFWNLSDSAAGDNQPVEASQAGTALISGFSANMMKCFLESKDLEFTPTEIMEFALEKYGDLDIQIPDGERVPFSVEQPWMDNVADFAALVETHLVPKKMPRKRKRGAHRNIRGGYGMGYGAPSYGPNEYDSDY